MRQQLYNFLNLHNGEEDKKVVYENIRSNISFRGSNLWILMCAVVIASIGLNVNSTAVVIGAMLISPLMGPIVGAGFALGTYDFELLKKSGKNLLIATFASLFVAAAYFYISPFKETQSELLSRTSPTIYDVLIAFFGGMAGIIALTRVEKGNPIPGVAIATALMPPLCTAGFAISIGNFRYFLGAFYLYTINCFFICIATFMIIKYLRYRPVEFPNEVLAKRIRYGITTLILVLIIPSTYLAYDLINERKFYQDVQNFVTEVFIKNGHGIIYNSTKFHTSPHTIELAFYNENSFTQEEVDSLNSILNRYHLENTKLIIKSKEETKEPLDQNILTPLQEKEIEINALTQKIQNMKNPQENFLRELYILFPEISQASWGMQNMLIGKDSTHQIGTLIYTTSPNYNKEQSDKLKKWVKQRLHQDSVIIVPMITIPPIQKETKKSSKRK